MTTLRDILSSFSVDIRKIIEAHSADDLESVEDQIEFVMKEYLGE